MKIKSVFSSCYLPPVYYYMHFIKAEEAVVDVNEFFVKQTYRNRCTIVGANGLQDLIVPIENRSSKILMKNMRIANVENWQKNHWKTIESAYRKSPFFEYYEQDLYSFYSTKKYDNLVAFNTELFTKINQLLNLKTVFVFSDKYIESSDFVEDYRTEISPKNKQLVFNQKQYIQVFGDKLGFQPNLSIIDLLFNEGPNSLNYLKTCEG
jgi:hypothetical protein